MHIPNYGESSAIPEGLACLNMHIGGVHDRLNAGVLKRFINIGLR